MISFDYVKIKICVSTRLAALISRCFRGEKRSDQHVTLIIIVVFALIDLLLGTLSSSDT